MESVPKLAASSPLSTNSTLGMTLTAGDGSSSYAVDIRTDSGYTNLVTGIVPDAQGKFSIPETAVFPGETNFLRIRGEGPQPSRYSAAATVAVDPTVTSSSPNQVKYVSVSRSGTQVTVRWQLQQSNGKKFKVYFTRADTGQAVLLTQFPLASTSTNITFLDQALASPCGLFTITQTLADGSQETLPSTGAGLPSPGGGDVFGGNQGGCDPDPPPSPGPSGPTWVNTFHHRDHLGSLRVTTDAAGWMLSGHDFYPFGMEVAASGQAAGGPSRMKFTGHERDDLTGLDYMKARYSGWFQASFLIPDPANDVNPRNPQSWNRYAYVRNNPINLVDPSGMNVEDTANAVISKDPCGTNQGGGATCDDRGLKARNDDASKKADEANRRGGAQDPAAESGHEAGNESQNDYSTPRDNRMVSLLDKLEAESLAEEGPDKKRVERGVAIRNDGKVIERKGEQGTINLPSGPEILVAGHIHTPSPGKWVETQANRRPSRDDIKKVRQDVYYRWHYVRGTDGRVTRLRRVDHAWYKRIFTGGVEQVKIRGPQE